MAKFNFLLALQYLAKALDWLQQIAKVVDGIESMTNKQKAEYCANIAADKADERIKLPKIFEPLDGPMLKMVLEPVFLDMFEQMYPETPTP
jgi:hypothetical protein